VIWLKNWDENTSIESQSEIYSSYPGRGPDMRVIQIRDEDAALKLLNFMGNFLFSGNRLEKLIRDSLNSFSISEIIDLEYLNSHGERNSKIFGIFDPQGDHVGGLIVKYYPWQKLKKQLYFHPAKNENGEVKTLSVESIASIIEKKLSPKEEIQLGIYLSYFTIKEDLRGKGLGRLLFQKFIEEVKSNPESCKLAFTITLGKYSMIPLGETLMKYLLEGEGRRFSNRTKFSEVAKSMDLPKDLFETDPRSYPTKVFAKESGFTFLGFSKYLGELWGKIF
jgi:GNAT superfamily N-acetyltransferase